MQIIARKYYLLYKVGPDRPTLLPSQVPLHLQTAMMYVANALASANRPRVNNTVLVKSLGPKVGEADNPFSNS